MFCRSCFKLLLLDWNQCLCGIHILSSLFEPDSIASTSVFQRSSSELGSCEFDGWILLLPHCKTREKCRDSGGMPRVCSSRFRLRYIQSSDLHIIPSDEYLTWWQNLLTEKSLSKPWEPSSRTTTYTGEMQTRLKIAT